MDQSNLFESLRTFYPTNFDDFGEPSEFTKTEQLTKEQFAEILDTKKLALEDLVKELNALMAYQVIKFEKSSQ